LFCCLTRSLRCAVRDMEEEDIGRFFDEAAAFIEAARECGGAALVHCHEGKSRSVTLVLAYFMQAKASLRASFPSMLFLCSKWTDDVIWMPWTHM
jgi:hypothetical protein